MQQKLVKISKHQITCCDDTRRFAFTGEERFENSICPASFMTLIFDKRSGFLGGPGPSVESTMRVKVLFSVVITCSNFLPTVLVALPKDILQTNTAYNLYTRRYNSGVKYEQSVLDSSLPRKFNRGCLESAIGDIRINHLRGGNPDISNWDQVCFINTRFLLLIHYHQFVAWIGSMGYMERMMPTHQHNMPLNYPN